jgi:DNA-binding transcriptional MocR family regulator
LQAVLLELLDDQATLESLSHARAEYSRRRQEVVQILNERNVFSTGTDGINLWVLVSDERSALMTLAAQGIGAAPGTPFLVNAHPDSMRLTVGLLGATSDIQATAQAIASAATTSGSGRRGQR